MVKSANYLAIIFNEHAERLTAVGGEAYNPDFNDL